MNAEFKKTNIDYQPDDYFRQIQMTGGVLPLHIDKDEKCTIDVPKTHWKRHCWVPIERNKWPLSYAEGSSIKKHRVNALELVFQTDCKAFIALSKYELGATRALNSSPGPLVFLWSIVSPPPPSSPYHSTTLAAFRQFYSLGPGLKTEPFDAEISGFFVPFYASSRWNTWEETMI